MVQTPLIEPFENIFDPKADNNLSLEELAKLRSRYSLFDAKTEIPRISRKVFGVDPRSVSSKEDDKAHANEHLIFYVDVPFSREQVFRVYTASEPDWYVKVEGLVYKLLADNGVLVPEVSATELRDDEFSYDFSVLEKIGTTTLDSHLSEHPEQSLEYGRIAGNYLGRIHRIPVNEIEGSGYFSIINALEGKLTAIKPTWEDAVTTQLEETLVYLVKNGIIDEQKETKIRKKFEDNKGLINGASHSLLHGDFYDCNILIDPAKGEISGAVDLSQAKIGDPAFDIAFWSTYYSNDKLGAFLKGYSETGPQIKDLGNKLALYGLRINLGKAKLRHRYNTGSIPNAIHGINRSLSIL